MNKRLILNLIAKVLIAEAVLLVFPMLVSVYYGEMATAASFGLVTLITIVACIPFVLIKPKDTELLARDGFLIVALTWIACSLVGALPFTVSGYVPSYVDAFFETVSGFTTTGSTILTEIESLPKGLLMWRSFTHWIGGMGVLLFVMAIVPLTKRHSMHLMRAELTGPSIGKLVPKGKATAIWLYGIYFVLTLTQIIMLCVSGIPLYDSAATAFATAGTGGFSVRNLSIEAYANPCAEYIISVFMLLFSINFNMYYYIAIRRFAYVKINEEWKVFLVVVGVSVLIIGINIFNMVGSVEQTFRNALFQVSSIISTTGFSTANFDLWPQLSKTILLALMVIGACAGSTGGGIKVSRLIIMFKSIFNELRKLSHPQYVRRIKMGGKAVEDTVLSSVISYMVMYVVILAVSCILISIDNFDFETTFSAVMACLNNIGPGFGVVSPVGNFSSFSVFSKIILSADMLFGRLELLPLMLIMTPSFWKK